MKKFVYLSLATLSLAACSSEDIVNDSSSSTAKDGPISFVMSKKNITRSYTDLQLTDHYNFGVFAYKSTDMVTPIMPNYLVGYYDDAKAYQATGTTVGDKEGLYDGESYWMYEGMGNAEYKGTYAGAAITAPFTSNNANQYLKYWDKSAAATCFYAYSPYINGAGTATYVDGTAQAATGADTRVLNIPNGTLKDGYDDPSLAEYMYASTKVASADYGHDVALHFKRLNAKVNIKFWEDVPGYKVRILTLQEGTYNDGVYAAAAIKKDNDRADYTGGYGVYGYRGGKYYIQNGAKIQFNADAEKTAILQYEGTTADNTKQLIFAAPTAAQIGENRYAASPSKTTYYAIPKGSDNPVLADGNMDITTPGGTLDSDLKYTGFTFHVTYELTAEDTGETITVSDATVHVPAEYCNWVENTHYTYIFKITKNTNGTTIDPTDPSNPDVDPSDPEVPTVQALYPIVFDNCTVEDWLENESEWVISEGNGPAYHDIQLNKYSIKSGDSKSYITITDITDNDTYDGHAIAWDAITIKDAAGNDVSTWYDSSTKTITVPANSAAGVYTITYTCPAPATAHATHPATWTEHFVIGDEYAITTALAEVATNGAADTKLVFTATKDGSNVTGTAVAAGQIEIEYPDNFTDAQKANVFVDNTGKVTVKKNATPGVYQLVYTVDEGSKIKVATTEFTVVDKGFTLSQYDITNKVGGTTITGSQAADATHVYSVSGTTTGAIYVSGNSIKIPNDTPEGTYTVTYTVDGGSKSEVVYTNTFTVKNQYAVTLAKDNIDSMVGTSADGNVSNDGVLVTLTKNEVAGTTNLTSSLKVVAANAGNDAAADANFLFLWDDTAKTITMKVKRGAAKTAYKVVYTGQTGVYAVANFVVK